MGSSEKKDIDLPASSKKRRRSDRYKAVTHTRSELYKDRHLANQEIQKQLNSSTQEKPASQSQANDPVTKKVDSPRENTPVKTAGREEEYLYDLLNKKIEEAEKQEETIEKPEQDRKEKNRKEKTKVKGVSEEEDTIRPLYGFLIKLGVFSLLMILMFTFLFGVKINRGDRMYPFIIDGDVLITIKITSYSPGDVVVYKSPETGKNEVSRIAAAGPCEVDIYNGIFRVDGAASDLVTFYETFWAENSAIVFPYEVTADGYFLLDDYRPLGEDGRVFGQISKKDLKGKVIYVFRLRGI